MTTIEELEIEINRLKNHLALLEDHFVARLWSALDINYRATLPGRILCCVVCNFSQEWSAWDKLIDKCVFGGGNLERYRCPECECVFGPQKYLDLDETIVEQDYRLLYARYSETDSTSNELRTFKSLNPIYGSLYLDWGCGGAWSQTVSSLRAEGHDVWGFEPSAETASEFVVNRRGAISARFDGIFSNNVIEHFRDPIAQFRDFHDVLKDGGRMAHSSPCYEYKYAFTRFHTLFLLGRSPEVLAERTGFIVVDRVTDGDYINVVFDRI